MAPAEIGQRARHYTRGELARALGASRARLRSLIDDLDDGQWALPRRPGVNPIAWESAHVAWFAELWTLRGPHEVGADGFVRAARPPVHAGPDAVLDSMRLAHADRWKVPLPSRESLHALLDRSLEAVLAGLAGCGDDDRALYFHRLALFHEDMHAEAFCWLRAAQGWAAPAGLRLRCMAERAPLRLEGGPIRLGWPAAAGGFAFDNELAGCDRVLGPFEIDATPVLAGAFREFVEAGGYARAELWPGDAGRWRAGIAREHPERWRRSASGWEARWFDRWEPLDDARPVIHVNAYEAEAFARFRGRRLPSAAEWEFAALAGARAASLDWGHSVWEWTADAFAPYPGFAPGPYKDYSAPWFGDHRELRGGAFATDARMHHPRYRNFFQPHRNDVFAGFRTARPVPRQPSLS